MKQIGLTILLIISYVVCYSLMYSGFALTLEYDIQAACGRKATRHVWKKKNENWIKRFTFWSFRKKINPWHYILFYINLTVSIFLLLCMITMLWVDIPTVKDLIRPLVAAVFLTDFLGGYLPYWRYRANFGLSEKPHDFVKGYRKRK